MKNEIYKLIFFISVFLLSCNRGAKNPALRNNDNYRLLNNHEQCFIAIYQKDSAILKFNTMPNGKINGKLVISYATLEPLALKREFYHGEIRGRFTKDTLFADYIFTDGAIKTVYRNPIALLKKGKKLILGYGAYVNYLGRTWLLNHKAINFTRCRFQFEPADCAILPQIKPKD